MSSGSISQAWLLQEFTARLASAFEGMTMEKASIDCEASGTPPAGGLLWRQPFAGSAGILWLAADPESVTAIGSHVLTSAGLSASDIENDPASVRSTYFEILGQTAGGLAQALSGQLKHEVTPQGGQEASTASGSIQWSRATVHLPKGTAVIHAGFDTAFLETAAPPQPSAALATPPTPLTAPPLTSPPLTSKTFELLLDVELPVSISFGRAQIQLKDALKLTTGSIIELNRSISEPAEVIVNNCVIARGEVVVVEGNFGIRIQQVISRQDRLRTLH